MKKSQSRDLISIIVPIYNVEQYLPKCLDSIINQTYKNLEIILVDDGSTDNSGMICDEYAKKDERFRVIHQQNAGVSFARNVGLKNCTGNYIGFVDPDDYISKDMYEILYNTLINNNSSISMCDYSLYYDSDIEFSITGETVKYNNIEAMQQLVLNKDITSHLWNKLYKKELFDGISFPNNKIYEDVGTIYLLFEKSDLIVKNNSIQYAYYQRQNSLCNSIEQKKLFDYIEMINIRYEYLKEKYPKMTKVLDASKTQYALIYSFRIAKAKDEKLYNNKILINETKKAKISFNLFGKIKFKYIIGLFILKINRSLFFKIFSR